MYDESALRRWMGLEMRKINEGIVAARVSLPTLLEMENPVTITRGGQEFRFDRNVLEKLHRGFPLPSARNSGSRLSFILTWMCLPAVSFLTALHSKPSRRWESCHGRG